MFKLLYKIRVVGSCYFILYYAVCQGAWIKRNDLLSEQKVLRKKKRVLIVP
jgi:hypothetical protein